MEQRIIVGFLLSACSVWADANVRLQKCAALTKALKNSAKQAKRSVSPAKQAKAAKQAQPKNIDHIHLVRVPVLQQTAGAVCGYHALYNVQRLMAILSRIPSERRCAVSADQFAELQRPQGYNQFTNQAYQIIQRYRAGLGQVGFDWLAGNEIEILNTNPNILIMEEDPSGFFDQQKLVKIHTLLTGPIGTMLGFVWNHGHTEFGASVGGTHWTGFVAVKCENVIRLFAMDSASSGAVLFEANVVRWLSKTPEEIQQMIRQQGFSEQRVIDALNNLFLPERTRPATVDDFLFILLSIDPVLILSEEIKFFAIQTFAILWEMLTVDRKNMLRREIQVLRHPSPAVQDILDRIKIITI